MFLTWRNDRYWISGGSGGGDDDDGGEHYYHKTHTICVGGMSRDTMRVDDAWEFLVFGLAKTGTTKGEKDDTRGIDSPAVYFCPRQWRMEAGFQRTLSQ